MSADSTLPKPIQSIIEVFHNDEDLTPSKVQNAIQQANVSETDLLPWENYRHPKKDGYGRKMVYKEGCFEIMVMSWCPGDFSAIHDHGFTQFGAVQIFGEADHAIFEVKDNQMSTLSRWMTKTGETIPVSNDLIHQMGNPGEVPFLSLHVYGTEAETEHVTGEARLYDLSAEIINKSNGGAFFELPKGEVVGTEKGCSGDFLTELRYNVEACYQAIKGGLDVKNLKETVRKIQSLQQKERLIALLGEIVDQDTGKVVNHRRWLTLQLEMKALARLGEKLNTRDQKSDPFDEYAPLYDAIIGYNSFDFQKKYLNHFAAFSGVDFTCSSILSVGCGTGMVEEWMCDQFELSPEQLLGIDIADSMIKVASSRIQAIRQDLLTFSPESNFEVVFTGLNVFQYFSAADFERAIEKSSELTKAGGYFVGDFITPDHISWYPNVMTSEKKDVLSFRTPGILDSLPYRQQESDIINVSFLTGEMHAFYAGRHRRILPSISEVVRLFEKYYGSKSKVLDAVTLEQLDATQETCESKRYVVIIQKEKDR